MSTTSRTILSVLALPLALLLCAIPVSAQSNSVQLDLTTAPLSLDDYTSSLTLPVSITASQLAQLVNDHAPGTLAGTQSLNIDIVRRERVEYSISRGAAAVRVDSGGIHVAVPLSGRATIKWCVRVPFGCLDDQKTIYITARANATFSSIQINDNWSPHADVGLDVRVDRARTRILGIPVDVTGPVRNAIRRAVPQLTRESRTMLSTVDLSPIVEDAWQALHRTFSLSIDPNAWLSVQPVSLGVSPVITTDDAVSLSIVISSIGGPCTSVLSPP